MGLRLYYAIVYKPQFEGGFFNRDSDAWERLFDEKFEENGWKSDSSKEYEVNRKDLQTYIKNIEGSSEKNNYFKDYTNEQVAENLSKILLSEDDDIRIEWF